MKLKPHASAAHDCGIVRADSIAARQRARLMAGLAECVRFIFYDIPRTPKAATRGAASAAFIIPRLNIAHQRAAAHRTALFRRQVGRDERNRRGIHRRGYSPVMKPGAHFPFGAARHQKRARLIFGIAIAPFRRAVYHIRRERGANPSNEGVFWGADGAQSGRAGDCPPGHSQEPVEGRLSHFAECASGMSGRRAFSRLESGRRMVYNRAIKKGDDIMKKKHKTLQKLWKKRWRKRAIALWGGLSGIWSMWQQIPSETQEELITAILLLFL